MGSLYKSLFNDIHLYELPLQASSSQILRILIWSICIWRGGGGGGGQAIERILSVLTKIGAVPNAIPTSKIWKNLSGDQKDQRRHSV